MFLFAREEKCYLPFPHTHHLGGGASPRFAVTSPVPICKPRQLRPRAQGGFYPATRSGRGTLQLARLSPGTAQELRE